MKQTVKIGTPRITTPNLRGELVRTTPQMFVVNITGKTFESKSSLTLTHRFTKGDIAHHNEGFQPKEVKFWKKTGKEVGGDRFIVNHSILDHEN